MSERASSGPAAQPQPADHPEPGPHQRRHRVVRSEDLPQFSNTAPVAVGTGIWVLLLAAALIEHDRLARDGHTWWIWCAVTGIVLGLLGWLYIRARPADESPDRISEDRPGSPPAG